MNVEMLRSRMPTAIRKKLMEKIYAPGNPIIMAGYENKYVFFLIEGEAEAFIQNNDGTVATVYLYKKTTYSYNIREVDTQWSTYRGNVPAIGPQKSFTMYSYLQSKRTTTQTNEKATFHRSQYAY